MGDTQTLEGKCNCGTVHYRISGKPMTVVACHCENCRRQSGAAYSVNLVVGADAVTIEGPISTYEDTATESGQPVHRDFCGTCGSPIRSRPTAGAPIAVIKAGTLNDPSPHAPAMHIWTSTKLDWVDIPARLPQFKKNLPG